MIYKKVEKSSTIPPESLRKFIWEGIEKREGESFTELVIPWHFGIRADEKSEPLTLRIESVRTKKDGAYVQKMRAKGYCVNDDYCPSYEISDGGRCIAELKNKLGDIEPYIPRIKKILYDCGMLELKGGRIITKTYDAVSSFYHTHSLNHLLTAISIISNLDVLLEVDGKIRKGGDGCDT